MAGPGPMSFLQLGRAIDFAQIPEYTRALNVLIQLQLSSFNDLFCFFLLIFILLVAFIFLLQFVSSDLMICFSQVNKIQ